MPSVCESPPSPRLPSCRCVRCCDRCKKKKLATDAGFSCLSWLKRNPSERVKWIIVKQHFGGGSLVWFLFPAAAPDFAASSFVIRSLFTINPEVGDSSSRRREISLQTAALLVPLETKQLSKLLITSIYKLWLLITAINDMRSFIYFMFFVNSSVNT